MLDRAELSLAAATGRPISSNRGAFQQRPCGKVPGHPIEGRSNETRGVGVMMRPVGSRRREPSVPAPVTAVTGAVFGALSRLRGARIFHPRGVGFEATVTVEQAVLGIPAFRC